MEMNTSMIVLEGDGHMSRLTSNELTVDRVKSWSGNLSLSGLSGGSVIVELGEIGSGAGGRFVVGEEVVVVEGSEGNVWIGEQHLLGEAVRSGDVRLRVSGGAGIEGEMIVSGNVRVLKAGSDVRVGELFWGTRKI